MLEGLFFEIGAVLIVAAALSFLAHGLRQPLTIAYIITGVIIGPGILAVTKSPEVFETMAQIGVAFLLFTVGLGLNWRRMKNIGGVSIAVGLGQVLFTAALGFIIGIWLGFDIITSVYLSLAFALSSTIIVVKMLMDKEDLETLYGKIAVGMLLVQDLIAMIILLILGSLSRGSTSVGEIITMSLVKGFLVIFILFVFWSFITPRLVKYASKSQELLILFALAWCFAVAGLLTYFGFGLELGALIAGLSLSGTIYEREINARIKPLRDFFLIIFFIVLGTRLEFAAFDVSLLPAIVYSLFVLIGNPLIVMLIFRGLGYHPQTGFSTGATTAQISEFSFIMVGAGIMLGHLQGGIMTLVAIVGIVTIAVSTYMVKYTDQIYARLQPYLRWLEKQKTRHKRLAMENPQANIMLFGFHRMGQILLEDMKKYEKKHLVVDFDPQAILRLHEEKSPAVYGDASDHSFLQDIRAHKAKVIISTIPNVNVSISILAFLKMKRYRGVAVVTVKSFDEAKECYDAGATYVIIPSVLGAEKFKELLDKHRTGSVTWKRFGSLQKKQFIG